MPKVIHQETMCGYKRCCPVVKYFEDGSIEISDDDSKNGSIGVIKFDPEQAKQFKKSLLAREE